MKSASSTAIFEYVNLMRRVFTAKLSDKSAWTDITSLLYYLREAITCVVCGYIANDPHYPASSLCSHHVCKGCRGKPTMKPYCTYCKTAALQNSFKQNIQLEYLINCFEKLCKLLVESQALDEWAHLSTKTQNGDVITFAQLVRDVSTLRVNQVRQQQQQSPNDNCISSSTSSKNDVCSSSSSSCSNSTNINGITSASSSQSLATSSMLFQISPSPSGSQETVIFNPVEQQFEPAFLSAVAIDEFLPSDIFPSFDDQNNVSQTRQLSVDSNRAIAISDTVSSNECILSTPVESTNLSGIFRKKPTKEKEHHCRCGSGAKKSDGKPGNLTCRGQRCACYREGRNCFNCRCVGCMNPRGTPVSDDGPNV